MFLVTVCFENKKGLRLSVLIFFCASSEADIHAKNNEMNMQNAKALEKSL